MGNKPYKFNDLKAPRFNSRKFEKIIVDRELYMRWKNETGYNIEYSVFRKTWEEIAVQITSKVLEERDGVLLKGIGNIYAGYAPARRGVNFKLSQELGKKIYIENWHTNGKVIKVIWGTYRRRGVFKRKKWWYFEGCRNFSRATSAAARINPLIYKDSIEKIYKPKKHELK